MLIYYIRSVLYWYKRNAKDDPEIKRGYYNKMHKLYKKLNKKYDILKIQEQINYERFMRIAETSWNMKHNIIFEIPNIIKIYKNKNNYRIHEIFNILKIYKNSKGKTIVKLFYLRDGKK